MTVFQVGSSAYSKSRVYHDEADVSWATPIGGVVLGDSVDADTGEMMVRVVGVYRGRPCYHQIAESDCDHTVDGLVNVKVLRDLLRVLTQDEDRSKDPLKHLSAKSILAPVVEARTPQKARR